MYSQNFGSRRHTNNVVLPRLTLSQTQLPLSLQRTGSLNAIALPKLSSRTEPPLHHSGLSSPLLIPKGASSSISSPIYKLPSPLPLSASVRSNKAHGAVQLYCANTHRGIIRDYNEDRVMIMLRIPKPSDRKVEKWPPCSFFGLYDGHGGKNCSNFLRDNLHLFITQDLNFPSDPQQAILRGFERAEAVFAELALKKRDKAGSCAVVVIIVGKKCYVANLGDSRAIMSVNSGAECAAMTKDHKPNEENENQRVIRAGGEVYSSGTAEHAVFRILPGRLAVSRAFGDIEAKLKELGGNPHVLIAIPEIRVFYLNNSADFIVLASDGIFDRLENQEVIDIIWAHENNPNYDDMLEKLTRGVEAVITESMNRESLDNVTVLAIAFENYTNSNAKRKEM